MITLLNLTFFIKKLTNMESKLNNISNTNSMTKKTTQLLEEQTVASFQVYSKKHGNAASFVASTSTSASTSSISPTCSLIDSVSNSDAQTTPNNEYSNLSENTSVNVLCSIAANPNSVLRAKQASTQLNSGESSRPVAQWLLGNERIAQIKIDSSSHRNFAANLMVEFFSNTELTNPNCNVRGKVSKGNEKNKENTVRLDANKILNIKSKVLGYVEGSGQVKEAIWKDCITAMNQRMAFLKKEKRLNNNNNSLV